MSMIQSLKRALELTDSVHEAIQAGDWVRASELELERRAAIEAYAASLRAGRAEGGAAPPADAQAMLELLQDRSLRMIGEAQHHRHRLLREAETVETRRAAAAAYADN